MSFDWNLSSEEENGFDDWANVDLNESLGGTASTKKPSSSWAAATAANQNSDDDFSSDSDSDDNDDAAAGPSKSFAGVEFFAGSNTFVEEDDADEEEVDWEDAVDGNDGETSELATDTGAPPQLKPVTVDWTQEEDTTTPNSKKAATKKRRVARKRYRFEHLTPDLQFLLSQLERAHLLSLTAHAMHASRMCVQDETLHVAHSLLPLAWVQQQQQSSSSSSSAVAPTKEELQSFCLFFSHLVHPAVDNSTTFATGGAGTMAHRPPSRRGGRSKKKRKLSKELHADTVGPSFVHGTSNATIRYRTKEYCAHLAARQQQQQQQQQQQDQGSNNDTNRDDFNSYDQVHLFIAMARSLGWRARYVLAIEPCKRDLDVHHPLFVAMNTRNVFQRLWKRSSSIAKRKKVVNDSDECGGGKMPANTRAEVPSTSKNSSTSTVPLLVDPASLKHPICWVEILCRTNVQHTNTKRRMTTNSKDSSSSAKLHWIHVDPVRNLMHQPESVEVALYASQEGIPFAKANQKKKKPIPYALAAEHVACGVTNTNSIDGGMAAKLRLSDVTPRYATSFVETLKYRGVLHGKRQPVNNLDRVDKWWATTLKLVNMASHSKQRNELQSKGTSTTDAIVLDLDDSSEHHDDVNDDEKKSAAVEDKHILDEVDDHEARQLQECRQNEPIPTSKTAFKTNPVYVLPSLLNPNEVLKPDSKKRVAGIFKGEFVFQRTDVETACAERRWLYKGRQVKPSEVSKPIKRVKARTKPDSKSFKALKSYGVGRSNDGSEAARDHILETASQPLYDGMENLYASWQTLPWAPDPVGPGDPIPVNEYKNIELVLLNPGLAHIDEHHVAKVAKKLGIPYAPCLLGFEGRHGNRTPTIRGIVVHQHNEEILREAHVEMASHLLQEEHENRQKAILLRWKRLMVGVLTRDRLDRAYGDAAI